MKVLKVSLLLCITLAFANLIKAQSDDINISAAFSSSIDLTVTSGANISFVVATLDNYTNGLADPTAYNSEFEVNSSVSFKVDLTSTNFTDAAGNVLDAANFGYTIADNGTNVAGTNHLLLGDVNTPSAMAVLGTNNEIVTATGSGNAGNAAANAYVLKFELGTAAARAVSGLPTMLEQNITPGTYTAVVTLTATAMP
ncbi:MAG: hypothetical protein SF052_22465 [Bacteroidia bacterium]|nr:hypothetical protein [Bacteroidia bacterium]